MDKKPFKTLLGKQVVTKEGKKLGAFLTLLMINFYYECAAKLYLERYQSLRQLCNSKETA